MVQMKMFNVKQKIVLLNNELFCLCQLFITSFVYTFFEIYKIMFQTLYAQAQIIVIQIVIHHSCFWISVQILKAK